MNEETIKKIRKKRIEASHLFNNYVKYYKKRNLVKTSEFLWGSIANLGIALAYYYRKRPGKHREIILLLKNLAEEELEEKEKYIDYINAANALHSNFYHNWMSDDEFDSYIRKGTELRLWLLKKLDNLE